MAAAYIGEILRSGIQSVDPGQLEASRALGFSYTGSDFGASAGLGCGRCLRVQWSFGVELSRSVARPFDLFDSRL